MSENETKRQKSDENEAQKKSIHDIQQISLSMFSLRRVLNQNSKSKWIAVEAEPQTDPNRRSVIIFEKMAFNEENVRQIIEDKREDSASDLRCDFRNDIYGNYFAFPRSELNGIKTTIIDPADTLIINKYLKQEIRLISETPQLYNEITLPHILSKQLSLKWVQNILDHKSETERIVYEMSDPETGFVLLPDMKWDGIEMDSLYLMAICHKSGIRSLRDLNESHLPLLNNIKSKGCEAIRNEIRSDQ